MADGSVQSIQRAFAVLQAVATESAGISEVARRTDLPISTVARLLATLEGIGAVTRHDDGVTYGVGPTMADLAAAADPKASLVMRVRPYLLDLVSRTSETAGISVPTGSEVLYLDHVEAIHEVQVRDWTGTTLPLHVVSSGLVLLAHRTAREIDDYISSGLVSFTERTIVSPDDLKRRLAETRQRGVVWTRGEYNEGVTSVAAPVYDQKRSIIAAVHCHGPSYRFPLEGTEDAVASAVMTTARRVSAVAS